MLASMPTMPADSSRAGPSDSTWHRACPMAPPKVAIERTKVAVPSYFLFVSIVLATECLVFTVERG